MINKKSHIAITMASFQPVANFVFVNIDDQAFVFQQSIWYLFILLVLSYSIWFFLSIAIKSKDKSFCAFATASLVLFFFNFHLTEPFLLHISENYLNISDRFRYQLFLHVLLLVGILVTVKKVANSAKISTIAVSFLAIFTLVDIAQAIPQGIASVLFQRNLASFHTPVDISNTSQSSQGGIKPNVYLIIPDGMPGEETVALTTGGYKYKIVERLKNRGFTLIQDSISNGMITLTSVPHLLSMNYFLEDGEKIGAEKKASMLEAFKGANIVVSEFRSRGYRYYQVDGSFHITKCSGYQDVCVGRSTSLTELDMLFLKRTMLYRFASKIDFLNNQLYPPHFEIPDLLKALPDREEGPFFFHAHFSMPHMPFRFNSECTLLNLTDHPDPYEPILAKWQKSFREQLICAEKQLSQLVDAILVSDPEAIIVIQSDHGSAHASYTHIPQFEFSSDDIKVARGIFSAFRVPQNCRNYLRDGLSPVNTFRFVFSCLDGSNPIFLQDLTFAVDPSETLVKQIK
jgi:hypothetical protein